MIYLELRQAGELINHKRAERLYTLEFTQGRKLHGRVGLDPTPLIRSANPGLIELCGSGGLLRAL
jgi:hypothetical protein